MWQVRQQATCARACLRLQIRSMKMITGNSWGRCREACLQDRCSSCRRWRQSPGFVLDHVWLCEILPNHVLTADIICSVCSLYNMFRKAITHRSCVRTVLKLCSMIWENFIMHCHKLTTLSVFKFYWLKIAVSNVSVLNEWFTRSLKVKKTSYSWATFHGFYAST